MPAPFKIRMAHAPAGRIELLPSPCATFMADGDEVRLFGPHNRVWHVATRAPVALLFTLPSLLKILLGHPHLFVDRRFTTAELPMLGPFRTQPVEEWPDLLADARDAVPTHFDEEIFLERWPTLVAGRLDSRPPLSRRQDERIVARYAGQPPKRIPRQVRLATQLAADIYAGSYNPSGDFADQSHYIRECRAMTGRTPAYWVRSRAIRLGWDGEPVAAADTSHT
ncbi:helix-turn-helix transcriptional regulator [Thermobifida fusca]|uniref:helix-turn-helix transcriptional regulator n=1 Tax=Thermobifida fusca TaxID=2021 RepID=UPI001878B3BA|nr:helix-turn-helix transcriptional regulator [Thermobifida fusca]QOS59548.1 helix-turn-helix transcriptional regulator [Thermobifida fusca]